MRTNTFVHVDQSICSCGIQITQLPLSIACGSTYKICGQNLHLDVFRTIFDNANGVGNNYNGFLKVCWKFEENNIDLIQNA